MIEARQSDVGSGSGDVRCARRQRGARRLRTTLIALAGALVALGLTCGPAFAASTHPYETTFSTGENCSPREAATSADGYVYVVCEAEGLNGKYGSVRKFDSNGNPVPFTDSAFYISGNEINEDPANPGASWDPAGIYTVGMKTQIEVDNSSAHPGYIYLDANSSGVNASGFIDIFKPSGEYVTSITGSLNKGMPEGVGIDQNGFVYVVFEGYETTHIAKYNPNGWHEVERLLPTRNTNDYYGPCCIRLRPDAGGAVWVGWGGAYFDGGSSTEGYFGKYEADQFNTNLNTGIGFNAGAPVGHQSPLLTEAFPGPCPETQRTNTFSFACALRGQTFDVDLNNNDVYGNAGTQVVPYSQGTAGDPVHQDGPAFGEGVMPGGQGIAIDQSGNVYVTANPNEVVKFSRGSTLPTVTTKPAAVSDIGHTTATVRGLIDPAGGGAITACQVKWGEKLKFKHFGESLPMAAESYENPPSPPNPPVACNESAPFPNEVTANLTGLTVGHTYHYRLEASNAAGMNFGGDRTFEAKAVLGLVTNAAEDINEHEATLQGELKPDGMATKYYFDYGANTQYGQTTNWSGSGTVTCDGSSTTITGVTPTSGRFIKGQEITSSPATCIEPGTTIAGFSADESEILLSQATESNANSGEASLSSTFVVNAAPNVTLETPAALRHLQTGHTYHFRLVATNELGTTRGKDMVFRSASPPEISGVGAENVTDTTADLHATINPVGYPTTYQFEYGISPSYGQSLSASTEPLEGSTPQTVTVHLSNLPTGATIHYRVVATNAWGTATTDDTTFSFRAPDCPNAHVRAMTGSSYLPDCRAYEIVSPGFAGAVQLLPGEAFTQFGEFAETPQNFGYASNPSRFVYAGASGSITGLDAPNTLFDVYLATRTNTGWVTTLPGLKGNETLFTYGRECSDSQDLCVDHIGPHWDVINGELVQVPYSQAPFLYKADGTRLGRLPTNVDVIKGGSQFTGDEQFSGDFSHFIFSTQTAFVPPPEGMTTAPGSVYDNDIAAKTVTVISKQADGTPIPVEPPAAGDATRVTGIAGVSTDGSRVLLAGTTNPPCSSLYYEECPYILEDPARLYMRVNDSVTYEVSGGKEVNFVGMTRNGSKVLFTSTEKLLPSDKDESRDLYQWRETEAGGELTLISQEGTLGNDNACHATWTVKCGVQPLTPEKFVGSLNFRTIAHVKGLDDVLANESGDIYFYSPEDLVAGEIGGDDQRNLYLYRNGHLHLVATFEPGTEIERSTISQDGSHAAFMTKASLTAYNAEHHSEVYTYNADTGALRCGSCNPAGTPPMSGEFIVTVSESGAFMANDGRTFFTTKESLVPQDTDGIRDVYEYVDGHAQLITSGTGDRENTGGLELLSFFFPALNIGLESVSRDGVDVYFSTFETLAPEDKNGSFLKFYDARSGGGFDFIPELGRCVAADECHGVGSSPAAPQEIGTGGSLGKTGNLPAPRKKHHKRHRKRHATRHRKGHRSHRNG